MAAEVGKPASPISRTLTLGAATEVEVAVTAFAPLLDLLEAVPDPRRAEGKVYRLPHVLLFSILTIVSGGNSYRSVVTFIDEHRRRLNRTSVADGLRQTGRGQLGDRWQDAARQLRPVTEPRSLKARQAESMQNDDELEPPR